MVIEVKPNEKGDYFKIRNIEKNVEFDSYLFIKSGEIQVDCFFSFDSFYLDEFKVKLSKILNDSIGEAKLMHQHNPNHFIKINITNLGQVEISGKLDLSNQHVDFSFQTDQTCIQDTFEQVQKLHSKL